MDIKRQLLKYLDRFESHLALLNHQKAVTFKSDGKVEFFSGIKLTSYYVPKILDYLNYPPYSDRGSQKSYSWFVEIWIDRTCVFRKSKTNEGQKNLDQYETELIEQMMTEIFFSGLFNSWDYERKR